MQRIILASSLGNEIIFSASRSSGAGGQNVNKVNTKITLKFDVKNSQYLTEEEKEIILKKLSTRLTNGGVLILTSQEKRSQLQNKEDVVLKLEKLLAKAFEKKESEKSNQALEGIGAGTHKRKEAAIGKETMEAEALVARPIAVLPELFPSLTQFQLTLTI